MDRLRARARRACLPSSWAVTLIVVLAAAGAIVGPMGVSATRQIAPASGTTRGSTAVAEAAESTAKVPLPVAPGGLGLLPPQSHGGSSSGAPDPMTSRPTTAWLGSTLSSVSVGGNAESAIYDSKNGYVYVVNEQGYVSVINGTLLVGRVDVGGYPGSATYDQSNGWVYVPDGLSGTVSVINGTTGVGTVTVGGFPLSAAFDSGNGLVYVAERPEGSRPTPAGSASSTARRSSLPRRSVGTRTVRSTIP